jgi:hypothetical protein
MGHNFKQFLWEESDLNPLTRLWHKDSRSPILNHKLSEFIKIVEFAAVQVFGSVEDEHIFKTANFIKNKL